MDGKCSNHVKALTSAYCNSAKHIFQLQWSNLLHLYSLLVYQLCLMCLIWAKMGLWRQQCCRGSVVFRQRRCTILYITQQGPKSGVFPSSHSLKARRKYLFTLYSPTNVAGNKGKPKKLFWVLTFTKLHLGCFFLMLFVFYQLHFLHERHCTIKVYCHFSYWQKIAGGIINNPPVEQQQQEADTRHELTHINLNLVHVYKHQTPHFHTHIYFS